jgi:hypothetical protein
MQFVIYKPLAVSVAATSTLIVPAVVVEPSRLAAWTVGQVVAIGDKRVTSDGAGYWVTAIGTGVCAVEPDATDGDDTGDVQVTWRRIRPRRNQLIIVNDSDTVIYLGFGVAAEANKGVRLSANGGAFNAVGDYGYCPECDIYAIAAGAGGKNLCIQEG